MFNWNPVIRVFNFNSRTGKSIVKVINALDSKTFKIYFEWHDVLNSKGMHGILNNRNKN